MRGNSTSYTLCYKFYTFILGGPRVGGFSNGLFADSFPGFPGPSPFFSSSSSFGGDPFAGSSGYVILMIYTREICSRFFPTFKVLVTMIHSDFG